MPDPPAPRRRAATLVEACVVLAVAAVACALVLPATARMGTTSGIDVSLNNLSSIGAAHALYALDWNGRQWTNVVDDISTYGDGPGPAFSNYALEQGDCGEPCWHPALVLGWGRSPSTGLVTLYRYFQSPGQTANNGLVVPMRFSGSGRYFGSFRVLNARPLHDYLGGRFYDPVFTPPNDPIALATVQPGFGSPWEYEPRVAPPVPNIGDIPAWSSYVLSPAAMFHPDVMRRPSDGGWQDPWSLDHGFESPGLFQARHPSLKTHAIEHHWNQNAPPNACNPNYSASPYGCEPYYFNHSIVSEPATLFYDLSTRLLPNVEALAADQQVLARTGEGLWSRDTPLLHFGYLIEDGFDGTPLSHHILTTDGILGRDTLWTAPPTGASTYLGPNGGR